MQVTPRRRGVLAATGAVLASCAIGGVGQAAPTAQSSSAVSGAAPASAQSGELACVRRSNNAPWYKTIAAFEHADIQRTTLFACARFPGSMTGSNTVRGAMLPGVYPTPFNLGTRRPGEMYVYGGSTGDANPPELHTFIAKLQAGTGHPAWRTYLSDARKNNELHLSGAVDVLANGQLIAISDHTLYKLDGGTGKILAKRNMPTGKSTPNNSAFNGVDAFPDGTIIARSMNRPPGCTKNGYSAAASPPPAGCPGAPQSAPGSVLIAINPANLKVLNWIQLKDNIAGRVTTTVFKGHRYIYVTGYTQIFRYEWTGKVIKQDPTWGPVTYVQDGQTNAGAAVVMNGWVTLSTNGNQTKAPLGVVAISQANDKKVLRLKPNPVLKPGQVSYYYAKVSVDPANSRIYVMDAGLRTASAIDLRHGKLSLAWKVKELSNSYVTLIGPRNRRVFVETNIKPNPGVPVTGLKPGPRGANYTEQIQWRNAKTGKLLASSAYYTPAAFAAQVPPGYGGLIYDILQNGHIVRLSVHPKN